MEKILLNPVEIVLNLKAFAKSKGKDEQAPLVTESLKFEEAAKMIVRPRAILKWCEIESLGNESVRIDSITFNSRLLQEKLKGKERAFAAVITAGDELDHLELPSEQVRNLLKYATLNAAREAIDTRLKEKFGFQKIGKLNPGSLPDWPIANNVGLFKLIGNVTESIGVQMTDKFYMQPGYTVSELLFSSDEDYVNCSLCKKYDCTGRQIPFDAEAYNKIFK